MDREQLTEIRATAMRDNTNILNEGAFKAAWAVAPAQRPADVPDSMIEPVPELPNPWQRDPITHKLITSLHENDRQFQKNATCREYPRTDLGNSQRFVLRHGLILRYCHPSGSWYIFDGQRWKKDDQGLIWELAKDTTLRIADEAGVVTGATEQREMFKWAGSSQGKSKIASMIDLARSTLPILPDEMDTNPDLLNFPNGTMDLQDFSFHTARRDDLITKVTGCTYDPLATCPKWEKFLDTIMAGNWDLITYLQRAAGYSLTGHTGERVLFLCHGGGANGKSTFLNVLLGVFHEYGMAVEAATFCVSRSDSVRNDLAALKGARFVIATEAGKGKRLDEGIIKKLTGGGDKVRARFLFHEEFEFQPECKIWWGFNSAPRITDSTDSIWNRVKMIPFSVVIPESERDKHLQEKLAEEMPGIMNWMLSGLREYYRIGLAEPKEVKCATEEYRDEQDNLADFFADRCIVEPGAIVGATELYNEYTQWMSWQAPEEKVKSPRTFGFEMGDRQFKKGRNKRTKRKEYTGIRLKKAGE
jgi:putative DNA primase/helicase